MRNSVFVPGKSFETTSQTHRMTRAQFCSLVMEFNTTRGWHQTERIYIRNNRWQDGCYHYQLHPATSFCVWTCLTPGQLQFIAVRTERMHFSCQRCRAVGNFSRAEITAWSLLPSVLTCRSESLCCWVPNVWSMTHERTGKRTTSWCACSLLIFLQHVDFSNNPLKTI